MTPQQKIMRAAAAGCGLRLTPSEVFALSRDGAIATCADNDDAADAERQRPPRMACRLCGDGPETRPDLFSLRRVNKKGIPGIWECADVEACRIRQAAAGTN